MNAPEDFRFIEYLSLADAGKWIKAANLAMPEGPQNRYGMRFEWLNRCTVRVARGDAYVRLRFNNRFKPGHPFRMGWVLECPLFARSGVDRRALTWRSLKDIPGVWE